MIQSRLRNRLFLSILISIIVFIIPLEYYDWFDSAIFVYSLALIFITACTIFWYYWWFVSKAKPSAMYMVIGILFPSIEWAIGCQWYSRYLFLNYRAAYISLIESNLWAYRVFPEAMVFLWLFCWIMGRFFGESKFLDNVSILDKEDKFVFIKAQDLFHSEQQFFGEAQVSLKKAQDIFARAQEVFARAQEVFAQAQRLFAKNENGQEWTR